jgi:hypothetical protein
MCSALRGAGRVIHESRRPPEYSFFDYTLGVELILKLVAGLLAGLRGYFLIVAGIVAVPCIFFLLVLAIRLIKPSQTRPGGDKNS